ncbi:hypothetical protein [Geodermatophilus sp. URMC 64]
MASGTTEVVQGRVSVEQRVTPARCPQCVITLSLDDERPRIGWLLWDVHVRTHARIGIAIRFECPNGHCSDDDPALLKVFPSRRF